MKACLTLIFSASFLFFSPLLLAAEAREHLLTPAPTEIPAAILCLLIFILSYLAVMTEEKTRLRKSKPVILGAGVIWAIIAYQAPKYGISHEILEKAVLHDLDEYAGTALFLLTAMTYIAVMQAGNVFEVLRAWLVGRGLSYRALFWTTGIIAFFLSPIADNMTTALVMGAVILAVGAGMPQFISLACINVVVASNAGGAFSPFGDITTLMVWQAGHVEFFDFFKLFIPSLVNFIVPAIIMTPFLPAGNPEKIEEQVALLRGAPIVIVLFVATVSLAITYEQVLKLPAFMGMMTGLSLLMFFAYYHRMTKQPDEAEFDVFKFISASEWDTLLFFFGVIFSVGGLAFIGWLNLASDVMYGDWGATTANVTVGAVSAVIDNIPAMFAVLSMQPALDEFQWLLLTLTCGVGGSLLAIGSAAGVALMGTARGHYTFMGHMKWMPVIALGYAASIGAHFLVNS